MRKDNQVSGRTQRSIPGPGKGENKKRFEYGREYIFSLFSSYVLSDHYLPCPPQGAESKTPLLIATRW